MVPPRASQNPAAYRTDERGDRHPAPLTCLLGGIEQPEHQLEVGAPAQIALQLCRGPLGVAEDHLDETGSPVLPRGARALSVFLRLWLLERSAHGTPWC